MKTTKRIFSLLLMLCLFAALTVPAHAATSAQYPGAQQLLDTFKAESIKYNYLGVDQDEDEHIRTTFVGDNLDVTVNFYFDDGLTDVSLRVWDVIEFEESDLAKVLITANDLNASYKWVKFVVYTEDCTVSAEMDATFGEDDAGEICLRDLYRIIDIVDLAYPEFEPYAAKAA
ncbi:MAG: hypothetical protein IJ594_00535 [Oscillospiraceae bacterium]|nr:hypothetical protein [Oscillospiraceae bacterium]